MATRGRDWTEEELDQVIDLYLRTSFGRLHSRNPEIIELASRIGRTSGSVAMKMANIASIDDSLDRKGLAHATDRDRRAWNKFFERIALQARILPGKDTFHPNVLAAEEPEQTAYDPPPRSGSTYTALKSVRQGQQLFREIILTSYENRCAITGISHTDLLVAGHIRTWADDPDNRMNPRNGLCLNRLHDRAFENGLIAVGDDGRVLYSNRLSESDRGKMSLLNDTGLFAFPRRFAPDPQFLSDHRRRFGF